MTDIATLTAMNNPTDAHSQSLPLVHQPPTIPATIPVTRIRMSAPYAPPRVALESSAKKLDGTSRLNTDYDFFTLLRDHGRRAAQEFLDAHFDDIGVQGTVDLRAEVQAEWA